MKQSLNVYCVFKETTIVNQRLSDIENLSKEIEKRSGEE